MISEYTAYSGCGPPKPPPARTQSAPSAGAPTTTGTVSPGSSTTVVSAPRMCSPGVRVTRPCTARPSRVPWIEVTCGASVGMRTVTAVVTSTVVRWLTVGGAGVPNSRWSPRKCTSRTSAGRATAVSLSQYWNAWTKVIERIPPAVTLAMTITPTAAAPTHPGTPSRMRSVSPAPWNWGIR